MLQYKVLAIAMGAGLSGQEAIQLALNNAAADGWQLAHSQVHKSGNSSYMWLFMQKPA